MRVLLFPAASHSQFPRYHILEGMVQPIFTKTTPALNDVELHMFFHDHLLNLLGIGMMEVHLALQPGNPIIRPHQHIQGDNLVAERERERVRHSCRPGTKDDEPVIFPRNAGWIA